VNVGFFRPWALALIPLIGAGWLWLRLGRRSGIALGAPLADARSSVASGLLAGFSTTTRLATLGALVLVLAGPYRIATVPGPPEEGVAIVIALDVSESMRTEELGRESRLDAAMTELRRFVAGRRGDVIGLVTFSGTASVRVPPVLDRAPLGAALLAIPREAPEDGTALGSAVALAANRLRAVEAASKVVVAITDGESNAGALDPVTASAAAAALGIRVYALAVGGQGANALVAVAEAGGGRSFQATDRDALDEAYREIDAMEPSTFEETSSSVEVPAHAGLLWLAAGLLVAEAGARGSRYGVIP
jgi:Ca-activated chloride channel homolog